MIVSRLLFISVDNSVCICILSRPVTIFDVNGRKRAFLTASYFSVTILTN